MTSLALSTGSRLLRPGPIIVLLALAFRLFLFHSIRWEPNIIDDYDCIARNIAEGRGFSFDGRSPTICRGPTYPFLLSAIITIAHQQTTPFSLFRVVDSILDSLTALLVYLIARAWLPALDRRSHVAAGIAYALNPFAAFFTVKLGAEAHQTLIFALYLLLLHRTLTDHTHRIRHTLLLGVSGGLLLLSKSIFFPIVIGLPAIFLLPSRLRKHGVAAHLVAAIAISLSLLAPWTIRNYRASGRPVLVQTLAGFNFWYDFTLDHNRNDAIASGNLNSRYAGGKVDLPDGSAYFPYSMPAAADAAYDVILSRQAIQWAKQHPGGMLAKMLDNFLGFWYVVETPKKMLATGAFSACLLALALIGYVRARESEPCEANILFALPFIIAFIYSPVLGMFRYSLIVHPLLSVFSGIPLAKMTSLAMRR